MFGDEPPAAAERVYDGYVERGGSEHGEGFRPSRRMDEMKNGLAAGRLSGHGSTELAEVGFAPNFRRLILHAAAYKLLNGLWAHDDVPAERRAAEPQTWRVAIRLAGQ